MIGIKGVKDSALNPSLIKDIYESEPVGSKYKYIWNQIYLFKDSSILLLKYLSPSFFYFVKYY